MKTPKSDPEIQTLKALTHFEIMISKQSVKIEDAQYIMNTIERLIPMCERLRESRDNWRTRAETAEYKLKQIKSKIEGREPQINTIREAT